MAWCQITGPDWCRIHSPGQAFLLLIFAGLLLALLAVIGRR